MKFEYKLVFVDRKNLRPMMKPDDVSPQFIVDVGELCRTNDIVNPPTGMMRLLNVEQENKAMSESIAHMLAKDWVADVYFKPIDSGEWRIQRNLL